MASKHKRATSCEKVKRTIQAEIEGMKVGEKLSSVRELMRRYQASPVTVSAAIAELTREGLVYTRSGAGTFVASPQMKPQELDLAWQTVTLSGRPAYKEPTFKLFQRPDSHFISFGNGYMDETLQPTSLLHRTLKRAASRPDLWGRIPPEGLESLRTWFAQQLGQEYRSSDVLIFAGGQVALTALIRSVLPSGAPLLAESPTYFGILAAARAAGVEIVPVPSDQNGIRPDLLRKAFQESRSKLLYLQPLYSNPTGAVLSEERREAVLQAARDADAFIIEDDYARELTFEGIAPLPLAQQDPGRVLYLRSLTKLAAPGLRVAGLCGRGPIMTRLRQASMIESFFMSAVLQEVAVQLVTSQEWGRHLKALRSALKERRNTLVAELGTWPQVRLTQIPTGGYNAWVSLSDQLNERELVEAARVQEVQISGGEAFFAGEPSGSFIRLSFASASPVLIREGIQRLINLQL